MNRIPGPIYAAAGAGDLAYQKLRVLPKVLPEKVTELRGRVAELRPVVAERVRQTDLDRLRAAARRNATTIVQNAHLAQHRAAEMYIELVARGERVVHPAPPQQPDTPAVTAPADAAVTAAPEVAQVAAPEAVAQVESTAPEVAQVESTELTEPVVAEARTEAVPAEAEATAAETTEAEQLSVVKPARTATKRVRPAADK